MKRTTSSISLLAVVATAAALSCSTSAHAQGQPEPVSKPALSNQPALSEQPALFEQPTLSEQPGLSEQPAQPVLRGIPQSGNGFNTATTSTATTSTATTSTATTSTATTSTNSSSERGDATEKAITPMDDFSGDNLDATRFELRKPPLKALIKLDEQVDPFALDAAGSRAIGLSEVVDTTLASNLDIGIAGYNERSRRADLLGSYGKFLPDINLSYRYNYLKGKANIPFGQAIEPLRFNNPLIIANAGFTYWGYRGGSVLFGALQNRNNYRASRAQKRATISDALRQSVQNYYDLVLQEAILRIRVKAVETSEQQLKLNRDLRQGGLATTLEVLQAETQLSQDRQNLIDQQVLRRDAAIRLAEYLNLPQDTDLVSNQSVVDKVRIVGRNTLAARLVNLAIDNRPELKQYEELRRAAKKQVVINAARLQPTFAFTGNVLGIGETLSKDTELAPVTLAGATGAGAGTVYVPRQRQMTGLYSLGFNINWHFEGVGTVDAANIQSARMKAREAQLEQTKVLNQVVSEVRRSYLKSMQTDKKIDEAISQVRSANEELRLAQLRFQNGVGKNIDVLRAQQDYTSALIEKARAIVNFNTAQVDLLRNIGLISSATLRGAAPL